MPVNAARCLPVAVGLLCLGIAGCSPDAVAENSPAIPTPYTPQPPATLPADQVPADLPETIQFVPESQTDARTCADERPAGDGPALAGFRNQPGSVDGTLCLYGIRYNRGFDLTLSGPDGQPVSADHFEIQGLGSDFYDVIGESTREERSFLPDGDARTVDGEPWIALRLWLPVGMPAGRWQAEVVTPAQTLSGEFDVEPLAGVEISTLPAGVPDPLLDQRCATYSPGQTVRLAGSGYEAGVELALGLYYMTAFDGETDQREAQLARSEALTTSAEGTFETPYLLDTDLPFGLYYVAAAPPGGDWQAGGAPPCFDIAAAPTPEPGT